MKPAIKIIIIWLLVVVSLASNAQKVTRDAKGNYIAVKATQSAESSKPTGKTYTDSKGNVYPVYESKNGKLFVIRTSKAGNQYKQYLKVN